MREPCIPNPPTNIVEFRGFDSSIILIQRGGILMSIGNLPESLSQAMLVGTMLVGRLGVFVMNRVGRLRDVRVEARVVVISILYMRN